MIRILALLALLSSPVLAQTFPGQLPPNSFQCNDSTSTAFVTNCNYPVVNVKDPAYGATGNGTTDDTTAIQNAINSLPTTGGTVLFPIGNYKISSAILIGNGSGAAGSTRQGIVLQGVGNSSTNSFGGFTATSPKLTWAGAVGGTMLGVEGPLQGWGIQNLFFDCQSSANIGIFVQSAQNGDSRNISIINCKTQGLFSTAVAPFGSFPNTDSLHNTYQNINVFVPAINGAMGILLTGTSTSNTDYNIFSNISIGMPIGVVGTVYGIYFQACDSNQLYNVQIIGGDAAVKGFNFDYGSNPTQPASNVIYSVDVGNLANPFTSTTPGAGAKPNYIYGLIETNGALVPTTIANLAVFGSHNIVLDQGGTNFNTVINATFGHFGLSSGGTPTLTAGCNGAGSSVAGNDMSGTVTGQTAAATTCTLTFASAFQSAAPNCVAMGISSPLTGTATPATGTFVVNFASTANYKFTYFCPGN